MKPLVCIVGKSGAGKTTLIEKLIIELKKRNYSVGCVKHDVHSFEMDKEGKDTYRMTRAGADQVLISNAYRLALLKNLERALTLDEINETFYNDVDIILVEGYKHSDKKKIEVFRKDVQSSRLCNDDEIIALVSDKNFSVPHPIFGLDDIKEIADFIESIFSLQPTHN